MLTSAESKGVSPRSELLVSTRRVMALSAVAGCVEVIGYLDCSSIYPGIMTGNTVQLGLTLATAQWTRLALIAYAVASFFVGGVIASIVRRNLRRPSLELLVMAAILVVASTVRLDASLKVLVELPLLAIAMAMQGEAVSKFGGVSIQTIVVTNSMVKFTDALAGRYLVRDSKGSPVDPRPELPDVLLPGLAWLTYSLAAGAAAMITGAFRFPLLIPAVILVWVAFDLLRTMDIRRPASEPR
jgi:uncharacterized membrane protein YoaK (UPF0700 family)